ncbi:MAG: aldo/keto reductase [Treponema sp.]|nr:aldo/keto reductase [Treponema sp.]
MEYVNFGKTGSKVSRISFGCWEMGGAMWEHSGDETNIKAVHKALDAGITSFDTAEAYGDGHSEEVLGKAIAGRRKDIFLATKVAKKNLRPADLRNSITGSLKRLGTDYVDLYYIHWPNPEIPLEGTMNEMVKIQKEGLIKYIGVSNFDVTLLKEAMKIGRVEAVQNEYSLLQRDIEKEVLPFCRENSISVMGYSSIAKGILTGAFHFGGAKLKETDFRASRRLFLPAHLEAERELLDTMKRTAGSLHITCGQLALAWLFHQKGLCSALVGTQSEKHFLENIQAVDISLSSKDLSVLDEVSARVIAAIDGR